VHIAAQRHLHRLRLALHSGHRDKDGQVRSEYVAMLGSVIWGNPISLAERRRFWEQLPGRFAQVEAKFPGRLTADNRARVEADIERRIARPTRETTTEQPSRSAHGARPQPRERATMQAQTQKGPPLL
jgi:hypothetical protein